MSLFVCQLSVTALLVLLRLGALFAHLVITFAFQSVPLLIVSLAQQLVAVSLVLKAIS